MKNLINNNNEILIVDDEPLIREILVRKLTDSGYRAVPAEDAFVALERMAEHPFPLVLSDIMMPRMDGLELLRSLKLLYPDTAVVMITAVSNVNIAIEALKEGASDYLLKPFNLEEIVISLKNAQEKRRLILENRLYQEQLEEIVKDQTAEIRGLLSLEQHKTSKLNKALVEIQVTYNATLETLSTALDYRDNETEGHSQRVVKYSIEIANVLKLKADQKEVLARGAILHDIGKIGIPDSILLKPSKLTEKEWMTMRKHTDYGYRMLKDIPFLKEATTIVLHHQEKYDGTGYPQGLKGKDITVGARIFAIADTYDAMTTDRPYRKALSDSYARNEIKRCAGSQFDPEVVDAFLTIPEEKWLRIKEGVDKQFMKI
ncbi:MAG: response regulator [Nitrospira sp.]|nr:response regulator [Nitrospira sp.]